MALQNNVLEFLEHTAAQWPDKLAFDDGTTTVSFARLQSGAQSIGTYLAAELGVHNRPVAVISDRTTATVMAFMGVLYSGNFYVPIDFAMPNVRMEKLLQQLQPAAVVCQKGLPFTQEDFPGIPLFETELLAQTPIDPVLLAVRRKQILDVDPAYIIFTSGSTGTPKGIVVSHRSVIDFTYWFTETFGFTQEDSFGNQAPFYFDLSMKDLYSMLKCGASVHVIPRKCLSFPMLLIPFLDEHHITVLSWATAAFHLVANSGIFKKHAPQFVRMVVVGGEALQAKQLNMWRKALPQTQFVNLYGPTEVTVDCCYYVIDRDFEDTEVVPIGGACENMEVLLIDEQGQLAKQGQPGEICVRGAGLAQGYYGDWEKTKGVFVQNPLNPYYPDRMYRTGDLAVMGEDGLLRFLARKDNQIKHGGYRIELGEIETAVNGVQGIETAVCLFDREKDKIVCVYQGSPSNQELAVALRQLLPKYMVPNLYRQVAAMPHNANGKIDRVALKKAYDEEA